ncbi:MAG TPA: lysine--tRNA ligase [Actinomycetota bacterium]
MTEEATGREAEVLRARRASRERLGDKAFALTLEQALGAREPTSTSTIRERHSGLPSETATDDVATVAGRVVLRRKFGKLVFLVVRDRDGEVQLVCDRGALDDAVWALVDEIDLGDIIGATGRIGTTRKGELSIFVDRLAMLTKALRPLPEKWHGLRDPDLQQRQRYLHLATDPTVRRYTMARATVLRTLRSELDARGFVEVETPVLQNVAGGAMARPFTTHHNVLDIDLKLRISLELYLKRLLVGGLERVYEIGRTFRNEGIDREHNPEFTMVELYQAFADYEDIMRLTEELLTASASAVRGGLVFEFRGRELDLQPPWRRVTVLDSVSGVVGEEVALDRTDLGKLAERHDVRVDEAWGPGKIALELFEKLVEPTLWEPTFVCDFPREVSPLARPHRADRNLTEHFDVVIGGVEQGTAFSELTDPDEQRAKFELQAAERAAGAEETHPYDEDFLVALEHGMPPAGGVGIGIDRLLLVLTDAPSLRDLILFPHHRPEGGG